MHHRRKILIFKFFQQDCLGDFKGRIYARESLCVYRFIHFAWPTINLQTLFGTSLYFSGGLGTPCTGLVESQENAVLDWSSIGKRSWMPGWDVCVASGRDNPRDSNQMRTYADIYGRILQLAVQQFIGNSHLFGGCYVEKKLVSCSRKSWKNL